jgi:hypothetical protein
LRQFEEMERLKLGMQLPKVNFLDELQVPSPPVHTRHTIRAHPATLLTVHQPRTNPASTPPRRATLSLSTLAA